MGQTDKTAVSYGPVGAAKTLFALRPNVFPPWDGFIIAKLGYAPGGGGDYARYLRDVREQLRELSSATGVDVLEIPEQIGRPSSSPAKLIDEFNWVRITRGFETPTVEELRQWLEWADPSNES